MGLVDLFRPKHKHSNPEVRAEAVRELGPDEASLLETIARGDADAGVRELAIDRIDAPDVLVDIAAAERERRVRAAAEARAAELWLSAALGAEDAGDAARALAGLEALGEHKALAEIARKADNPDVRARALDRVTDPRALAEFAKTATDAAARNAVIARIDEVEVLRALATDTTKKDVGLAAIDRIDDDDALEAVAAKAKNKKIRARARRKLSERAEPQQTLSDEDKRAHAERVQLARRMDKLAGSRDLGDRTVAEVDEVARAWERVGSGGDAKLVKRFDKALARFRRRREGWEALQEAEANKARAAESREADEADEAAGEEADARGDQAPDADEDAGESSGDAAPEASEPAPAVSAAALESNLAAAVAVCNELDAALDADKLRPAERALQKAEKAWRKLGPLPGDKKDEIAARYHEAHRQVVVHVRGLRDAEEWKRWANVPRQEALIADAKALLSTDDTKGLGGRLKKLQQAWKGVGPVPRDRSQELWETFKATCDQVYERVKEVRARTTEEHKENLRAKTELCERVEALAESTDWDETAEEIKRLQREWKEIGPVARRHSDKIWKRFRAACDTFFERRKPHLDERLAEQQQNLADKEALCARVEALIGAEDWDTAAGEVKGIQREWKAIGHVPRKDAAALGKRFAEACDTFFDRKRAEREAARKAELAKLDALRADAASILDAGWEDEPSPDDAVAKALAIRAAVRDVDLPAEDLDEALAYFERLYRHVVAAYPAALAGTELDPEASRAKKDKLCARAEELVPEREPAPDPSSESPEQVAERLRAALADRALGTARAGATPDGRLIVDVVDELRASWARVGPVPGDAGEQLEQRFDAACQAALDAAAADQ